MNYKLFVLVLFGLFVSISADDKVEKIIESLKSSHKEAEKALTREQSANMNYIRSRLQEYERQTDSPRANEPLFNVPDQYYNEVVKTMVDSKHQVGKGDVNLSGSERTKFYMENFGTLVLEPCEIINKAYSSSLSQFFRQTEETPDLGEKVMASGEEEYEWLVNAYVCYNIIQDSFQPFSSVFGFSG